MAILYKVFRKINLCGFWLPLKAVTEGHASQVFFFKFVVLFSRNPQTIKNICFLSGTKSLAGAQPSPCCSFARHLVGKMVIHCSFAHH